MVRPFSVAALCSSVTSQPFTLATGLSMTISIVVPVGADVGGCVGVSGVVVVAAPPAGKWVLATGKM
jgi:hypothetical protein